MPPLLTSDVLAQLPSLDGAPVPIMAADLAEACPGIDVEDARRRLQDLAAWWYAAPWQQRFADRVKAYACWWLVNSRTGVAA